MGWRQLAGWIMVVKLHPAGRHTAQICLLVSVLPELPCQVQITKASCRALQQCHFEVRVWMQEHVIKFILIDLLHQKSKHNHLWLQARCFSGPVSVCFFFFPSLIYHSWRKVLKLFHNYYNSVNFFFCLVFLIGMFLGYNDPYLPKNHCAICPLIV